MVRAALRSTTATVIMLTVFCGSILFAAQDSSTVPQQIADLMGSIRTLTSIGVINPGQANSLIVKLIAASQAIDASSTGEAVGQLQAFVNEVAASERSGRLADPFSLSLISAINRIAVSLIPPLADPCLGGRIGDACSITIDDRAVSGICQAARDELLCVPVITPPAPPAVAACEAKAVGDSCSITIGNKTFTGTCQTAAEHNISLVCVP